MELEGQIAKLTADVERLESNVEDLREVTREGKKEMTEGES
jgi:outer membrane murein-binding lipoprotein Lpp